jgi:acetyl-CoA C-acetyltransferase
VPVTADPLAPASATIDADEGIREQLDPEKIASLQPVFAVDGSTTAANSSQISDGAAALLIAERGYAERRGLVPRARFVTLTVAASDPVVQFTAVLDATHKALERANLSVDDVDLFEVNEAFSGVPLMVQREFGIPDERLNVNGGSIAIGHPLGSTGARMLTDLLCELERTGKRYGLQTICEAGGTSNTTIIERI